MKRTPIIFGILLCCICNLCNGECLSQVYYPQVDFKGTLLFGDPVMVVEDPKGTMSLSDVMDWCEKEKPYKTLQHFQFGLTTSAHWLIFAVANSDSLDHAYILELVDPYLYDFQIHIKSSNGEVLSDTLTYLDNFNSRKSFKNIVDHDHQNFLFSLDLEPGEQVECYLKFKPSKQLLNFRLYLWDEKNRLQHQKGLESVLLSAFFLLCIIYLLILGVSIFITGFRYFWYYFYYVLFGALFIFTDMGLGYRFIWPESALCQQIITPILASIYLVFGTLFVRAYFNTRHFYKKLDNLLLVLLFLAICFIPLALLIPKIEGFQYAHTLYRFATLLYVTACLAFFWILFDSTFRSRKFTSGLFLFGFSLHGLSIIVSNLQYIGILPGGSLFGILSGIGASLTFYTHITFLVGMLIEMAMIFFIALRRFASMYRKNTQTLKELAFQKEQNMNLLVMGIESERERVAQDLHDGLGVLLTSVKMKLNVLSEKINLNNNSNKLKEITSDLDEAHSELRRLSRDLMPKTLYKLGLIAAVEELLHRVRLIEPELKITFYKNITFEKATRLAQLHLFRVVQEMINNVVKHANAKSIILQFVKSEKLFLLSLEDNGVGFDVNQSMHIGNGLKNIQYRISALNGQVYFDSSPRGGTIVSIEIPLENIFKDEEK